MNVAKGLTKGLDGGPVHFSAYSGTVRRGVVPLKSAANDNFGFGGGKASLDSIGAHIQDRNRHVVDSLSALIGTESVNIVVARALHLNGAMIANADKDENGVLTDHGHMTATIGKLFVQHIYDYDDGKTLAAAVSFAQNTKVKDKGGNAIDYFSLQGTFGSFDKDGYTRATLGQGDITIEQNPAELAKAHRDAATPQTFETQHNIKPTFFYYSNIDTKALIDAIPDSPISWAKSVGTTIAETLGFGSFRETEEEKSKRLEKERIKKAVEEFERNHAQAQKEQADAKKAKYKVLNQIDDEVMGYDQAKDYDLGINKQRRLALDIVIYELKEREGISTREAFEIAMPLLIKIEQEALLIEPEKSPLKKKAAITGLFEEEEFALAILLAGGVLSKYLGDSLKGTYESFKKKRAKDEAYAQQELESPTACAGAPVPPDDWEPDDDRNKEKKLSNQEKNSIKSLKKQINEHKVKLSEYRLNPEKFDNKNFLKNAPNDKIKQDIIARRISHLENEIRTFEEQVSKILNKAQK